jgi:hypothetical protein
MTIIKGDGWSGIPNDTSKILLRASVFRPLKVEISEGGYLSETRDWI